MTLDAGTQMRKGVVEYCVLGLLSRTPMYGWELSERLISAGMIASIGTLYPLLSRLRQSGWVRTFDQASTAGPVRRYYELTAEGRAQLNGFRALWEPFARGVADLIDQEES
ncbi:PadR family transcriptional regulator [Microbacterium pseudoresistens]|uniref:PadR family transcriptional regulator PadR n=1 Tax=Microbacterium pseudoresistens TaxID=640634 RepID=A0A7Y9JNR1_9MICO|nr:PadR family transcriptional regulator [Microbacterium pseudoresistens]NYD54803.1 PadR family transcriptional regulator PadR [Microbacterium pseudoresistens]